MKKYMVTAVTFAGVVMVISFLAHPRLVVEEIPVTPQPDLQTDVSLQRECAEMFRKIINIQDRRENQRIEFDEVHNAFLDLELEKTHFSIAREEWLEQENKLASDAAALYETGRTKGCFQKVHQREAY